MNSHQLMAHFLTRISPQEVQKLSTTALSVQGWAQKREGKKEREREKQRWSWSSKLNPPCTLFPTYITSMPTIHTLCNPLFRYVLACPYLTCPCRQPLIPIAHPCVHTFIHPHIHNTTLHTTYATPHYTTLHTYKYTTPYYYTT